VIKVTDAATDSALSSGQENEMAAVIEGLKREHRAIECVLRAMGMINERLVAGEAVEVELLERCIEFIRTFADGVHHQKEENLLFPAMHRCGVPAEMGPIACMLKEHHQGREFVARMRAAVEGLRSGRPGAADQFRTAAAGYAELLAQHIYKEDNILFMMAERIVGEETLTALAPEFERAEADYAGGRYEELETWAHDLEQTLAVGVPAVR
jgi:hemerythrin-like domain-containing protein